MTTDLRSDIIKMSQNGIERGEKMLNRNLLKAAIARAGYTQGRLAKEIRMSENALSLKMSGKSWFDTKQIDDICRVLNITENEEKAEIFLS